MSAPVQRHGRSRAPWCGACGLAPLALLLLLSSCRRERPPPPLPPAASARLEPLDRLLPGELPEGREKALGLTLPREMRVVRSFGDSVVARGRLDSEALTDYVRQRVSASAVQTSVDRTTFPRVHVNGAAPERQVKVELVRAGEATMLYIEDVTPPPALPGLSEEQRWRRAGVNPNDPLDPGQL